MKNIQESEDFSLISGITCATIKSLRDTLYQTEDIEMKYKVHQILLTKADRDAVNRGEKIEKYEAYRDAIFTGDVNMEMFEKFYTHVANIETSNWNQDHTIELNELDQVFHIGNIGPEEFITRLDKMRSISVGDVITDNAGRNFVVAPIGFVELS